MKRVAILFIAGLARVAAAGDDKADSLTVLPWTDTSIVLGAEDKRGVLEYAQLFGQGYGLHAKVSAPLDDDTHQAALVDSNHLAGGFQGSLQIGIDTRAERLAILEARLTTLKADVKTLSSAGMAGQAAPGWAVELVIAKLATTQGSESQAFDAICTQQGLAVACKAPELAPKLCTTYLGKTCTDAATFTTAAVAFIKNKCAKQSSDTADACGTVAIAFDGFAKDASSASLRSSLAANHVAETCAVYDRISPDKDRKCDAQYLADNAKAIAEELASSIHATSLERRDLLMLAYSDRFDHALMLSASLSYDRGQAYANNIASAGLVDTVTYDLQVGGDYTVYTDKGIAFNARAGFERSQNSGARTFNRCVTEPSTDPMVTGQACGTALFRRGAAPDASSSLYARAAIDYQFTQTHLDDKFVPGVELRVGVDGVFDTTVLGVRASAFATPIKGNNAARFGVAFDFQHAFDDDSSTPRLAFSSFLFIGATFSALQGN